MAVGDVKKRYLDQMSTRFTPEEVLGAAQGTRLRSIEILRSLNETQAALTVLPCPGWSVKDLTCHMFGVADDILNGRLDNVGSDAWTAEQVARHRPKSLAEICDDWESSSADFDAFVLSIPSPSNLQVVMDLVTHEHDIRLALNQQGCQDSDSVTIGLEYLLGHLRHENPELLAVLDKLELSDFEMLRVLSGRRSLRQLKEMGIDGSLIHQRLEGSPMSISDVDIDEVE
jgi:uncharacterized protein (TIGR03083 family)